MYAVCPKAGQEHSMKHRHSAGFLRRGTRLKAFWTLYFREVGVGLVFSGSKKWKRLTEYRRVAKGPQDYIIICY
jgi:hypothetical protein